ncbi:peptidoglycan editing factor PgeF [Reinekea sp.]|jgi:YfiH family protein|uniref:peptidoglycan editing factor PgeF n=1 Tax=Reinekea sp. TaxID=1970455 RepID=UPI002A82E29D|nr:peptidoglycan editing factor PgeF [Reinekea sp.]
MSFKFAPWPLPANVQAGWTTRQGGFSGAPYGSFNLADHVDEAPATVAANRQLLQQRLPGAPRLTWLHQTHSNIVVNAVAADLKQEQDGSYSRAVGLACCVLTADCLPVFFWTADGSQVAIAHAGWRGLADDILLASLATFDPGSRIYCGIGPAIGPAAFEVGPDVRVAFKSWPGYERFFRPKSGKYLGDLAGLATQQLLAAGVQKVYRANACTVQSPELYYSYRRDGQTGRMANLIWKLAL